MDIREIRERMRQGGLYPADGEALIREQLACQELLYEYNATRPHEGEKRRELLNRMFAEIGEGCWIEPPLHANWAGKNVRAGSAVYANFGLTLVDDGEIFIGDSCKFGPNVMLITAAHPIDAELRRKALQFNLPVRICENVWVGAGTMVLPGVTIGENSVIGAGSVVTKDIPPNVVAVGCPCRVLREIGERDRLCYCGDSKIDL